jgi:hypothetical protein
MQDSWEANVQKSGSNILFGGASASHTVVFSAHAYDVSANEPESAMCQHGQSCIAVLYV